MRSSRLFFMIATLVSLATAARSARAQEYLPAASVHVASGLEGGGSEIRRARTRLRFALELRVDEAPDDAIVVAGLVDLEPKSAVGGELKYLRTLGPLFAVSGGVIGYIAPQTLLGPCAGIEVRPRLGQKTYLTVGPEATAFVLGSDLPDGAVIWQTLIQVGFRADL